MDAGGLRSRITGTVVERTEDGYEPLRRDVLWNRLVPERRPDLIVQVASDTDVVTAVRYAREHGLRIAVRGGGHSWCGAPLRSGGMLLDLSRLGRVSVDAPSRTAVVEPAVTNRHLARELGAHGLAFPYGHCGSVALGGYLLSGGFGWNSGSWGPACFSVRAIEAVTAEGRLIEASEDENADLFWAARGAGAGFFAVVTRYHLNLQPLPRAITTSNYVYPLERLREVAAWAAAIELSRGVEMTMFLVAAPPEARERCASSGGRACIVSATAFADTADAAAADLAPLESCPVASECLHRTVDRPTPFDALFDAMDAFFPEAHRYAADTVWSNEEPARVLDALARHVMKAPSAKSLVLAIMPPPPADGAAIPDAAFSMAARLFAGCYAVWDDAARDGENRAWHGEAMALVEPFAAGHYIGESDIARVPARAPRCFAPHAWERLQELRRKWDTDGAFFGYFDSAA